VESHFANRQEELSLGKMVTQLGRTMGNSVSFSKKRVRDRIVKLRLENLTHKREIFEKI